VGLPAMNDVVRGTAQKALEVNLNSTAYGSFAEIGAGQEVARWFFRVGGAAGTVAKTISAYDMAVSDALYGSGGRYVSRERLEAMLEREFAEVIGSLGAKRGDTSAFFAFANTVAARSHRNPDNGHGWAGIRFQTRPRDEPSQIILHVHLMDRTAVDEQEALGILGVNLICGAVHDHTDPSALIGSLMDELSRDRVEIDLIKFSGPAFAQVDNRLMSLQLVEQGLTDAAMFTAAGEVKQPSEVLHKKPVLVERGTFRPPTRLTIDLLERARDQFLSEPRVQGEEPVVLAEMTLRGLSAENVGVDHADFLDRAEVLGALGIDVLISRFQPYYELADYLSSYTDRLIGLAVGMPTIGQIADEKYYTDLPGGVLESVGKLFKRSVKMYVYPTRDASGKILTFDVAPTPGHWKYLRDLLLEIGSIEPIRGYDESLLSTQTPDVLSRIRAGDPSWEEMVPPKVAEIIRDKKLFGFPPSPSGGVRNAEKPAS
jgi:hypothetical protein